MGKVIKFRRRRWTKARHYGASQPTLPFWPKDRNTVTARGLARDTWRWLKVLRPVILLAILLTVWPALDPALIEPPSFLQTAPEQVSDQFTRCGLGRGWACVIDGDTFKLGERKVRIISIDAPETHPPRCAQEAALGEAATAELQRLLNQGAFEMVGRIDDMKDRYGRDLRVVRRLMSDGSYQSMAEEMRKSGLARRYWGGFKTGWC